MIGPTIFVAGRRRTRGGGRPPQNAPLAICPGGRRLLSASHLCYSCYMSREITQRELRNDSGEIMRALERGESFIVTRNSAPVGELIPLRRRRFVSAEVVMGAFAGAPRIDPTRFRADVDSLLDQDPTPRV